MLNQTVNVLQMKKQVFHKASLEKYLFWKTCLQFRRKEGLS